jgi:hypothetical protein
MADDVTDFNAALDADARQVRRESPWPFTVTYFADIEAEHPKQWVIDGFIGRDEMTVIYGAPSSGKSALLGDAAAHVAAGRPWFDREVEAGAVIYVAAERHKLVEKRLAAWRKHHGVADIPLVVVSGAFDLCSRPDHVDALVEIAREAAERYGVRVVWVIIDTKARVLSGADPNADADTMKLVANVQRLQGALGGPHVSFIDHTSLASPERNKGSGALAAASDGSFRVTKDGDVRTMTIGAKEPNDGPDDLSISFTLQSVEIGVDAKGKVTKAPIVGPADADVIGATTHRRKLKPAGQKVWLAFGRLLDEGRTCPAPSAPGVSPGTRAVTLVDLREMSLKLGIYPYPEPGDADSKDERTKWRNGRNAAWKRGHEEVVRAGLLRLEDDFFWNPRSGAVTETVTSGDRW